MTSKSWSSCLSLGGIASRCSMPRTRPRSSELSWVRFDAYSPKRTTRTTRRIGRASKRWARDRMVSQETMANTMERTSSKKKVSRHSSLWRRSNCSRRSETAMRPAAGDERRDGSVAPFLILLIDFLVAGNSPDDSILANIVRTVLTHQQHKPSHEVPYRHLCVTHK